MVPTIKTSWRSFKAAAACYLYDHRHAGEARPLTADRVGWTATVNLCTDNPETAWRIMTATAMRQGHLKIAAGVRLTGRKLEKPVFAYTLAWPPGDRPGQQEQIDACHASLKVLGLEERQAVIVSHTDGQSPHVHVLVNRVHPDTGKAATLSHSTLKLWQWARQYEKTRRVTLDQDGIHGPGDHGGRAVL